MGTGFDLIKSISGLGNSRYVGERVRVEANSAGLRMQRNRSLFHVNSTGLGSRIHFPPPWLGEKPQASPILPWVSVSSSIK